MSLEVEYIDAPSGAQESGKVESTGAQTFSSNVLDGSSGYPIATLEDGVWKLDGTMRIMENKPHDIGWWSYDMSDAAGLFTSNPKITIIFPVSFSATGLTFTFSPSTGQYCSELKISWYSRQILLKETVARPDSSLWVLEELVEGFDRIVIEIVKTSNPFQFAKIEKIMIGQSVRFGRNDIVSATISSEADHKLCELTVDAMKLEIHDRKHRKLLPQENQRIELHQNGQLVAVQYIKDSQRESPYFYTLSCESAIGLLEDNFLGGMYGSVMLETLVKEIVGDIRYEISPDFKGTKVSGYLPVCSRREALQQVAFAVGALITTYGTDAIKLNKLPESVSGSFGGSDIFTGAKVTTSKKYAKVEVARHSYTKSEETEQVVNGEYISGENVLITFNDPHYNYAISGGTITGSGANWVTVTANGPVSISAKKYIHNTVMQSRRNQFATLSEQSNVLTVDGATLVTAENATEVLNRLYDASTLTNTLKEEVVIKDQSCGNRVSSLNPWGTQTRGFITSMSSTYTQNGQTSYITIQGVEVETEGVYYYAGELYSGDTEVIY